MALRIGIIGQAGEISAELADLAYRVGGAVARRGAILLSGGRDGVIAHASRGARDAGGITVGILPGDDPAEGNEWLTVPVTTGLGMEWRSLVLVHSSDVLIMLAGGNGTLGELSAAYLNRRPVVVVTTSGGWAGRLPEMAFEGKYLDHRRTVEIRYATDAESAVEMAVRAAAAPGGTGAVAG